ncbi:MAG: hypothetical protein OIF58_15070 [Cohaesibacter sp.]|nr:hypothetical protein [Cohaesibacter sp.]
MITKQGKAVSKWLTHTGATAAAVAAAAPLGGAVDDEVLRGPCPAMSLWDFLNKTDMWSSVKKPGVGLYL